MQRVVIINTPQKDPASQWALLVDEDLPVYFYDFNVAMEWLKERWKAGDGHMARAH